MRMSIAAIQKRSAKRSRLQKRRLFFTGLIPLFVYALYSLHTTHTYSKEINKRKNFLFPPLFHSPPPHTHQGGVGWGFNSRRYVSNSVLTWVVDLLIILIGEVQANYMVGYIIIKLRSITSSADNYIYGREQQVLQLQQHRCYSYSRTGAIFIVAQVLQLVAYSQVTQLVLQVI